MEMEEAKLNVLTNPVRSYPRSNARSRYGRPAAGKQGAARSRGDYRRRGQEEETKPHMSFRQRVILQAIICSGLLAILLFFNIMDTTFTNNVMGWVDRNISYDMLAEEGGIGGWMDSVLGIFNNDVVEEVSGPYHETFYNGAEAEPIQITPQANTVDSSRVDENILREINETVDIYYESNRP